MYLYGVVYLPARMNAGAAGEGLNSHVNESDFPFQTGKGILKMFSSNEDD